MVHKKIETFLHQHRKVSFINNGTAVTKHKIKLNKQCFKCIETLKGNFHTAELGGISDSKPTQQMPKI